MSRVQDTHWHEGASTHQVRMGDGAGVAGAMITLASLAVGLLWMPRLWIFLMGAAALGVGFAVIRAFTNRKGEIRPLLSQGTHAAPEDEAL